MVTTASATERQNLAIPLNNKKKIKRGKIRIKSYSTKPSRVHREEYAYFYG
jgi:hypothetical protein